MTAIVTHNAPFVIEVFGPMKVLVEGYPLPPFRSRKALWALALLTLRHNRPVEREWLAATLWPDMDQTQAFANLRPILSELRKAMDQHATRLQAPDRHTLRLDLTGAQVDLVAFDAAVTSKKLADLEMAVELYKGPLLEGCPEEWVFQERNAREQACLRALLRLGEAALEAGNYSPALGYFQRAATLDPWSDEARRGWMAALAGNGDRNAALQVYREFVEVLRSDPQASPEEETTVLYVRLRAEARGQSPKEPVALVREAGIVGKVTGYLPSPLTELVGREEECLEVGRRLRQSRLVTLTGMGGIGKTRLAIEVARRAIKEFPDGVWFVALEALSDNKQVLPQVASVLGVREEPGFSLLESVTRHLRQKRTLLLLDNCEHVVSESALITGHLLRECAGVRAITTSREALGITGETTWAVPSLAVPDPTRLPQKQDILMQEAISYESVQLFVERAQAVQTSFALTRSNAQTVARVCHQLEGIPLALELAAARIKVMSIEQIAERLTNELDLLKGGNRAAMSRQQTLRATLDWSYSLLSEAECLLLRRLSVFAGGCTLNATEYICSGESILEEQVLDLLTSLVDKSLVVFEEPEEEIGGRYRMLEMVRQYAWESLQASSEVEMIKTRHRDYFVALAEEAEAQMKTGEQERWLRQLEREYGNMRVALELSESEKDTRAEDVGIRLAGALYLFWYVRGYWSEGREHLSRSIQEGSAGARTVARAKALCGAGMLAYSQADYSEAQALNEESLDIFRELGDLKGVAESLSCLGKIAYDRGDYTTAKAINEECLSIFRDLGDQQGMAWTLNSLGNVAHPQGNYAEAQALYEESLHVFQEMGNSQGVGRSLTCLGYVAFDQGKFLLARALYEESLHIFQELGDRGGIAWSHCCLGYSAYDQEDYQRAQEQLEKGLSLFSELGDRRGVAWARNSLGNVAFDLGDYTTARSLHEGSLNIRRELGDGQGMAWSLICLGKVAYEQGEYPTAQKLLEEGLTFFQELGDRKGIAESLERLASVMQAQSEVSKAVRFWAASQTLRESIGAPRSPKEENRYAQQLQQSRTVLGESAYAAAWEEGCFRIQNPTTFKVC